MNSQKNMWPAALMTFGLFMIMASPIMGNQILMVTSGIFFFVLSIVLMKVNKK